MASAKVDNRGSFGSKRSRNDGLQKDGDWTCPQCGNVNFGFRAVCNISKCGAPRPPATPRMGPIPVPGVYDHAAFYPGRVGVPLGMTGSYGPPIPLHYDYGVGVGSAGPYGLPMYGPPATLGGMGYGPRPALDGYGFGFHGSPLPVQPALWSGGLPDSNGSRKRRGGPDGSSEGDWICPKCENINFAFRTTCNMKCGTSRPNPDANQSAGSKESVPDGSWTCSNCNNLNYPFRTVCNRKGCGMDKASAGK